MSLLNEVKSLLYQCMLKDEINVFLQHGSTVLSKKGVKVDKSELFLAGSNVYPWLKKLNKREV